MGLIASCIMLELGTSNSQMGYRAMWKCLRDKYNLIVVRFGIHFVIIMPIPIPLIIRDTVMQVLRVLDPEGVRLRRSRRLKRRVYTSKVGEECDIKY